MDETVVNRTWVEDKLVHSCMRCSRRFNLINRKHHCRCCGKIFCNACSDEQRIVTAISSWQVSLSLRLILKVPFFYTVGILFHVECLMH